MKVLFDHQTFCEQQYGGISRYFTALIHSFGEGPDVAPVIPFRWIRNRHLLDAHIAPVRDPIPREFRGKRRLYDLANRPLVRHALRHERFDVFHPTFFGDYFLNDLSRPFVLTIYDFIPQRVPSYFAPEQRDDSYKRTLAARAARVIAISEHTRRDTIALLGLPPEKVVTVHLAADRVAPARSLRMPLPGRFVLFVGQRFSYKNFARFSEAAARLMAKDPDLHLVCAGGAALSATELTPFTAAGVEHRVHQRSMPDEELAAAYARAALFVFPSLYEGFGLPILEAFQQGCPTALSNTSCLPEIGGDAAVYFDPEDTDSIEMTMETVLRDAELSRQLRAAGPLRADDFSWRKTADGTLQVYRSVA